MDNIKFNEHLCVTDTELDKVSWSCDAKDILLDIKFFMRKYYNGFFNEDGESLNLKFNNGQRFIVSVKELKQSK